MSISAQASCRENALLYADLSLITSGAKKPPPAPRARVTRTDDMVLYSAINHSVTSRIAQPVQVSQQPVNTDIIAST